MVRADGIRLLFAESPELGTPGAGLLGRGDIRALPGDKGIWVGLVRKPRRP